MVQDTAPNAVRIADPIDTMICKRNFVVSFLLIISSFLFYPFTFLLFYLLPFYLFTFNLILGTVPKTDCPQVEINRRADRLQDRLVSG